MIIVVNRGGCPANAIRVVGHTTKDGSTTVGRFGSGFAYAVALAVRLGIKISVSSEDDDGAYEMSATASVAHVNSGSADSISARVDEVNEVVWLLRRREGLLGRLLRRGARRIPSGFAASLGARDWSGAFPIVREIVANARDADPDGWRCWYGESAESTLRGYIEQEKGPVTIVKIDDSESIIECESDYGPCGEILECFDDHFRWPGPEPAHRSGMFGAIYRKTAPGPARLFVRGVRCPWPSSDVPESLYDYSIEVELNEARSIKDPISATTAVTYLWHGAPMELKRELLEGVKMRGSDRKFIELMVNEFVGADEAGWRLAWRSAFGDAPAAAPADAPVRGAVRLPPSFVAYVGACGVPTVGGRSRESDGVPPSFAHTAWIEVRIQEVNAAIAALKSVGVAPALVASLERIAPPCDEHGEHDEMEEA